MRSLFLIRKIFTCITFLEKQVLEASYKGLISVSSEAWPEVLTRLSARGEWASIRFLVLGIDFRYINGTVVGDQTSIVKMCSISCILHFISLTLKKISYYFLLFQFQFRVKIEN